MNPESEDHLEHVHIQAWGATFWEWVGIEVHISQLLYSYFPPSPQLDIMIVIWLRTP